MQLKPLKVSELNQYVKRLIMSDPILYNISVEGEIFNFKHHHNGNMYFTIKDEKSRVRCVMFFDEASNLDVELEDGMSVEIKGYVSVYEVEGSYQLYVKEIKEKGKGELYEALNILKQKLSKEGLFSPEHKKTLPHIPNNIGIITSSVGAAVKDIITNVRRRMDKTNIYVYQVMVQGERAKKDICKGIRYFNSRNDIDVIIIARGGGSAEELWVFNDEGIAREIYKSEIPIVSAVGHETDFTIADFVSDVRVSTPTAAAEIVVPSKKDIEFKIKSLYKDLISVHKKNINLRRNDMDIIKYRLNTLNPKYAVSNERSKLNTLYTDIINNIKRQLTYNRTSLLENINKLDALSPLAVLNRGYNIAINKEDDIIKSTTQVKKNDELNIILHEGKMKVKVIDIESKVKDFG